MNERVDGKTVLVGGAPSLRERYTGGTEPRHGADSD